MLEVNGLLIVDLDKDPNEDLTCARKVIQEVLERRKEERHHELYLEAKHTGDPSLIALGAAMMRFVHRTPMSELLDKLPCETSGDHRAQVQHLAYYVANHCLANPKNKLSNEDHDKLRQKLLRIFDVHNFVFTFTHYDECHNGYFFRRS